VPAQPEIGHQLGLVNRGNLVDRFDLHDQAVIDDEVHLVAAVQFESPVAKRQFFLPRVGNPGLAEFMAQALLIGAFEQPWAQVAMHLDGKAYNQPGRVGTLIAVHDTFVSLRCIFL